jgi:hypothetical protein
MSLEGSVSKCSSRTSCSRLRGVDGKVKRAKRVDDDAGGEKSVGCQ